MAEIHQHRVPVGQPLLRVARLEPYLPLHKNGPRDPWAYIPRRRLADQQHLVAFSRRNHIKSEFQCKMSRLLTDVVIFLCVLSVSSDRWEQL